MITGTEMDSRRIAQIADPQLRNVLISTAENIERMLKSGQINLQTPLGFTSQHGLRIKIALDYKGEGKPTVFTFTYLLDNAAFEKWLNENPHLTEGILSFVVKGIEITVPPGKNRVNKSGFSIDGIDGERDWLPLLQRPAVFKVHRDVFGGREWECYYVDQ